MKVLILIFHVCNFLTNFIDESQSGHSPLTLYSTNGYYEVQEFETARSKIQGERPKDGKSWLSCKDNKLQALLCCPPDPETGDALKFINVVQKVIYIKDEIDEAVHMCSRKYIPSRVTFPLERASFADNPTDDMMIYEIGYEVCDENKLIKQQLCRREISLRKQNEKCDFFAKLTLLHDAKQYRTLHTRYELTYNANLSDKPCKKGYTFDEDWDREKALKIKGAYSRESQYVVLKHIILPSIGFDPLSRTANTWKEQVREDRPFLKAQLLAPKEDFHDEVFGYASCNYSNMAPMWKSVADTAWRNVENMIRSVAAAFFREIRMKDKQTTWFRANKERVIKTNVGRLIIITGTNGVLKVESSEKDGVEVKELYLLRKESITVPIPEKFWKVVMYEVPATKGKLGYRYGIFLVTDNSNKPLGNELCNEDICEETGWNKVNNGISTRTYCCPVNEKNWRRFGVSLSLFPLPIKVLNLNSITTRNVDDEMVTVNVFEKLELAEQVI